MNRFECVLLAAGAIAAFAAGVIHPPSAVQAAVPNPCPEYQCKDIHAYWDSVNAPTAQFLSGTMVSTVNGYQNIFATSSLSKPPLGAAGPKIDLYTYPACSPTCGKDAANVWQAPQEIAESGAGTKLPAPINQQLCTPLAPGDKGIAPQVVPPVNMNKTKAVPPGN